MCVSYIAAYINGSKFGYEWALVECDHLCYTSSFCSSSIVRNSKYLAEQ